MRYLEFLDILKGYAEKDFADFQRKLIFTRYEILGVRTPTLRRLAKELSGSVDELLAYPNDYYETVFLKLTAISSLPYEAFVAKLEYALSLMDSWALCDCFKAKCIVKRRKELLPILEKLFSVGKEYYVRYVLVTLLSYYVEEEYLPLVTEYLRRVDCTPYYVHMAAAWLTAELLVKHYDVGVAFLKEDVLPKRTHNKAIRKAIESYRVTKERKDVLRSLKIK